MAEKFRTQRMVFNSFPNVIQLPSGIEDGCGGKCQVVVSLQQLTIQMTMVYRNNISCETPCSVTHNMVGSNTKYKMIQ